MAADGVAGLAWPGAVEADGASGRGRWRRCDGHAHGGRLRLLSVRPVCSVAGWLVMLNGGSIRLAGNAAAIQYVKSKCVCAWAKVSV